MLAELFSAPPSLYSLAVTTARSGYSRNHVRIASSFPQVNEFAIHTTTFDLLILQAETVLQQATIQPPDSRPEQPKMRESPPEICSQ
jgi:hypothetical protein